MKSLIKFIPFVLFLIINSASIGQELYVCESYTEDGTPVGPISNLSIKPYGTGIYLLVDNEAAFNDPTLYIFVDKLSDNAYKPYDSKMINVNPDDSWAVTSFEFSEVGTYEIYVLNSSETKLATTKLKTRFADQFSNNEFGGLGSFSNDIDFTFCELVINGKPVNQFNSISLSNFGGQVFIYINNRIPFNIDKIIVQVWKRSAENSNYEELVDTRKYRILPEWKDTFFKYIFTQTGEFKVDVFDENNNFIASNVILITN